MENSRKRTRWGAPGIMKEGHHSFLTAEQMKGNRASWQRSGQGLCGGATEVSAKLSSWGIRGGKGQL